MEKTRRLQEQRGRSERGRARRKSKFRTNDARAFVDGGRDPEHLAQVVYDDVRHEGYFVVAVGAETKQQQTRVKRQPESDQ